eukprot:364984-Chlamydomonas_euryale.AAC.4
MPDETRWPSLPADPLSVPSQVMRSEPTRASTTRLRRTRPAHPLAILPCRPLPSPPSPSDLARRALCVQPGRVQPDQGTAAERVVPPDRGGRAASLLGRPRHRRACQAGQRTPQALHSEGLQARAREAHLGGPHGGCVPAGELILHRHCACVPGPALRVQGPQQGGCGKQYKGLNKRRGKGTEEGAEEGGVSACTFERRGRTDVRSNGSGVSPRQAGITAS